MKIFVRIVFVISLSLTLWVPIVIMDAYFNVLDVINADLSYNPGSGTKIFDVNGILISELYLERREFLYFDEVSPVLKKAFLSAEDIHFYSHRGYNPFSILRAAYINVTKRGRKQGGSTITQQLSKQLYAGSEKTLSRKIGELFIAMRLESRFDKDKIFEMYLNHIYFGHGVYGVKSASDFYFKKDASKMGVAESAILATIAPSPNNYSPLRNPRTAHARASGLLRRMHRQNIISESELNDALSRVENIIFVEFALRSPGETVRSSIVDKAPHFTEYIRRILVQNFSRDMIYRRGLNVHTTLDLRVQEKAELHIKERLKLQTERARQSNRNQRISIGDGFGNMYLRHIKKESDRRESGKRMYRMLSEHNIEEILMMSELLGMDRDTAALSGLLGRYENVIKQAQVEAAFISIDPFTGAIVAMVGGSDTRDGNQFNRAVQSLRQPGSAFKIFVYGAGIESNAITAATQFNDLPLVFNENRREWTPSNYGKDFVGTILTRRAVAASINTSSVSALEKIGVQKVIEFASNIMNIPQKRFHAGHSLALGTSEVSPIELACGVASFANGGFRVTPFAIQEITDNQLVRIFEYTQPRKVSVMQPSTAYIMTNILRGVVDSGTAHGGVRRVGNFKHPAAGKTGTNTQLRDAWFAGYTPDLASVVWVGCNSQHFSLGYGGAASELAAPIWGKIMQDVYTFRPRRSFSEKPPNVDYFRICKKSGKLFSPRCNGFYECFVRGTEPIERCDGEYVDVLRPVTATKNELEDLRERMRTRAETMGTTEVIEEVIPETARAIDDDKVTNNVQVIDNEEYEIEVVEFD